MKNKIRIVLLLVVFSFWSITSDNPNSFVEKAHAAALTNLSDTLSSSVQSVGSDHTIQYITPTGVGTLGIRMEITFPSGYSLTGVDDTDIDMVIGGSSGTCSSWGSDLTIAASAGVSTWGASVSGQMLALTSPNSGSGYIPAGYCVQIEIGQNATGGVSNTRITNPSTPGTYSISIGGSMWGDSGLVNNTITSSTPSGSAISNYSDTLSRIQASTASNHTIQFITPTGIPAGGSLVITFPASTFTVGALDIRNYDLAVSGSAGSCSSWSDITLLSSPSGTTWGVSSTSSSITFLSSTGTIPAGYCVQAEMGTNASYNATNGVSSFITNPAAGTYDISISAGLSPTLDTGSIRVLIIADDTVNIYATVDPILGFTISDTAVGFGTFTAGAIRYATDDAVGTGSVPSTPPVTLAAASNANSGYYIRIRSTGTGSSAGMYNAVANALIAASGVNSITTSTEAYGAYANLLTGTGLTIGTFSGATSTTALTTSDQTLASTTGPTLTGTAALFLKANVLGTSKAGAYSDTLTLTCTATF